MDDNTNEYLIKIAENGPYRVTGGVPLLQRYPAMSVHGEPLEWDPVGEDMEQPPSAPEVLAVPLRALVKQAVLRWHPRRDRLRRQPDSRPAPRICTPEIFPGIGCRHDR